MASSSAAATARPWTASQEKVAAEFLAAARQRGFYAALDLDLDSDANAAAISRAYKKQALRFHPDKNSSPSAEAAMRAVNQAFEVLSDPSKREWYDYHGFVDAQAADSSNNNNASNINRGVGEEDVDAAAATIDSRFDIYVKSISRRDAVFQSQVKNSTSDGWHVVAILAMVWVFAISTVVLSSGLVGGGHTASQQHQQPYVFSRDPAAEQVEHWTHGKRIAFYTSPKFQDSNYPEHSVVRKKIEAAVEAQHRQNLLKKCVEEEKQSDASGVVGASRSCLELEILYSEDSH